MPNNLTGVLLFVVLLFPGYVFERRREIDTPDRLRTPFHETLSVIFVGVITDSVLLISAALFFAVGPSWAPDPVTLLAHPTDSLVAHRTRTAGLLLWVVGGACTLAYLCAARPWAPYVQQRLSRRHRLRRLRNPGQSAWWLLFNAKPGIRVYVGCYLDDGSYVGGLLYSYSRAEAETADRELTLRGDTACPLLHRSPSDGQARELEDVGAISVSARHIVMLTTSYLEPSPRGEGG